ncbi:hypothetical protein PG997_004365 [Apiospora hydei]|uniref:Uncharacterized protein n=1 Tax=Apiospora hydei TaxID=1337664 RepID=A0ABR1X254_9PEZI
MASQAAPLQRFKAAMGRVYGSFESFANWRVPPLPGNAGHRGRYLWADAFGVVNFVTLRYATGEERYLDAAKRLAAGRVGRRTSEGGLRIGKVDEAGPDGDGQYHHYLTLWIHPAGTGHTPALHCRKKWHWGLSMVWKISTDMSRPLSRSKGHLDDVTGYVVFEHLDSVARRFGQGDDQPLLAEKNQYWNMMTRSRPLQSSTDMLDLGMSLWVAQFRSRRGDEPLRELGTHGINTAREILVERKGPYSILTKSAGRRLAFRELGACLGIKCYSNDADLVNSADLLVEFWGSHTEESTPDDLMAITQVMLAAALIPGAFDPSYPAGRRLEDLEDIP